MNCHLTLKDFTVSNIDLHVTYVNSIDDIETADRNGDENKPNASFGLTTTKIWHCIYGYLLGIKLGGQYLPISGNSVEFGNDKRIYREGVITNESFSWINSKISEILNDLFSDYQFKIESALSFSSNDDEFGGRMVINIFYHYPLIDPNKTTNYDTTN